MTTTYDNGNEMNTLSPIEMIEWGGKERNKLPLRFIDHLMGNAHYTITVSITATKTIIKLDDFDGVNLKTLTLRHWHDGYLGIQIIGGGAYAITSCNQLIDL